MARLAEQVAAAPGSFVLPERPRAAAVTVPGPLRLLDALDLGAGRAVAVVADAAGGRWTVPVVWDGAGLRRARPGDGVAAALASSLASIAAAPPGGFSALAWHAGPADGERAVAVDQTNESVIAGDAAVVKWSVRLPAAGEPPQPALARLTTLGDAGFPHTPRPWGVLRWRSERGDVAVATAAAYLPGALDGWDWAVADVQSFADGGLDRDGALAPARMLGQLTADLHVALATAGVDAAGPGDAERWRRRAMADLDETLALLGGAEGERVAHRAPALRAAFTDLGGRAGTPLLDVHGDLHVGQWLRTDAGAARSGDGGVRYAVTDFDGNPVLPPSERALRAPAALDVAGMLASLDHVGRVVLRHAGEQGSDGPACAWPFTAAVRDWIVSAQREFLGAYRARLSGRGAAGLLDERLLWPLRLHQEIREHLYAVRHLPHWRYVPDAALLDLLPSGDLVL